MISPSNSETYIIAAGSGLRRGSCQAQKQLVGKAIQWTIINAICKALDD